ncbi:hypothetical protein WUBG_15955, partial [Wuchereria bancrofti]
NDYDYDNDYNDYDDDNDDNDYGDCDDDNDYDCDNMLIMTMTMMMMTATMIMMIVIKIIIIIIEIVMQSSYLRNLFTNNLEFEFVDNMTQFYISNTKHSLQ